MTEYVVTFLLPLYVLVQAYLWKHASPKERELFIVLWVIQTIFVWLGWLAWLVNR